MTVKELISILATLPQDHIVSVYPDDSPYDFSTFLWVKPPDSMAEVAVMINKDKSTHIINYSCGEAF